MSVRNGFFQRVDVVNLAFWRASNRTELIRQTAYFVLALVVASAYLFPIYWLLKVALMWPPVDLYGGAPSLLIENPTLYNFIDVYRAIPFPQYFKNSVIIAALVIVGNLVFNSLAAYALTREFHGRRIVQFFLIAAMMIPLQASIIPAFLVTKELGLINTYLGVALPNMTVIINILILKTSFDAVPESILESARLDGASELYILFGVYWPLAKPALATNVILSFVIAWNDFLWPLVIISEEALQPLPLALANFTSRFASNFALQYAFSLMVVLPIVVVFLMMQRQFIESIVATSVKE